MLNATTMARLSLPS